MLLRIVQRSFLSIHHNTLHSTCANYLDQSWRSKKGLTENPNAFGPLTTLPDYSFKDGRPVPLGIGQRIRLTKQRQYADKIRKLVAEVDGAVKRHTRLTKEREERKQDIFKNKFKSKGNSLLSVNNKENVK